MVGRKAQPPRPVTRPDDVPKKLVDMVRDVLTERAGYRRGTCPELVKLKFEETARIACAIIIDEERARDAATKQED